MTINIFSIEGVDAKILESTVKLLNEVSGPLKFKKITEISLKDYGIKTAINRQDSRIFFKDLESISEKLRENLKIPHSDYIVLLTDLKLDFSFDSNKQWFGYFIRKNIFIRTYGWEDYSKKKPYIAISHQIIENIFQSLSGHEFERFSDFHYQAKGCVNDFCEIEYEIEYKLRSGFICRSCLEVAINNGVEMEILTQIKHYFNYFREQLLDYESIIEMTGIPEMQIDKNGNIFIGGKEVPMDHINKTFYIFAVIQRGNKISARFLKDSVNQLERLYFAIKRNATTSKAVYRLVGKIPNENMLNSYEDLDNEKTKKYIKDKRNEIKTDIKNVVGEELSEIYKIGSDKYKDRFYEEYYSIFPKNSNLKIEVDEKLISLLK